MVNLRLLRVRSRCDVPSEPTSISGTRALHGQCTPHVCSRATQRRLSIGGGTARASTRLQSLSACFVAVLAISVMAARVATFKARVRLVATSRRLHF